MKKYLQNCFLDPLDVSRNIFEIYEGTTDPTIHIEQCIKKWRSKYLSPMLWAHKCIHTLGTIPQAWYLDEETHKKTRS